MTPTIRTTKHDLSDAELDAIEQSHPLLIRQAKPGVYVVLTGPVDHAAQASQHDRLARLYRERLAIARAEGDRGTVEKIELLPEVHERRAGEERGMMKCSVV